jgi:hypothetical protein
MILLTVEFVVRMVGSQRPRFPMKCSTLRSLVYSRIVCTTLERVFLMSFFYRTIAPLGGSKLKTIVLTGNPWLGWWVVSITGSL